MHLKPIQLRRRRWTLFFSIPFTVAMLATLAFSIFLLITVDERLVKFIAGVGGFGAFCVAGTLGKSVLEALYDLAPAVTVDARGLHDLRGGEQLIPWHRVERVLVDTEGERIRVYLTADASEHKLLSGARRLVSGGDLTVALGGLVYNYRHLSRALAEYHRQGKTR